MESSGKIIIDYCEYHDSGGMGYKNNRMIMVDHSIIRWSFINLELITGEFINSDLFIKTT
jgi:hypothetical protein